MPTKSKSKTATKLTKVSNLPKSAKSLQGKSMNKVKGGVVDIVGAKSRR